MHASIFLCLQVDFFWPSFHYKWKRTRILAISEMLLEKFIKNDR